MDTLRFQYTQGFQCCWLFLCQKIKRYLSVPVGLINANWGGTPAEVWTPADLVNNDPELKASAGKLQPKDGWHVNAFIHRAFVNDAGFYVPHNQFIVINLRTCRIKFFIRACNQSVVMFLPFAIKPVGTLSNEMMALTGYTTGCRKIFFYQCRRWKFIQQRSVACSSFQNRRLGT